jgi:hypothetical protein
MGVNSGITARSAKRISTGEILPAIIREAADVLFVAPNTGINIGGLVEGKGGDFATITEAIAYAIAAGCSASRPFTIRCSPAFYTETFNFIDPTTIADLGIIVKGDPFCVIASDVQHTFRGYRPGFVAFEDVVFRGSVLAPEYQLYVDQVGMSQSAIPNFMQHVRFENVAQDGGGNFSYLSSVDIVLHEVTALDRIYLATCGRIQAADCHLLNIFQSYDAVLSPLPLNGARGGAIRESTLSYYGANSLKGNGDYYFQTCDISRLGMGKNVANISPNVWAYFCAFLDTLDIFDTSTLTEYGCMFNVQPTVSVTASISWSAGAGFGRGSYMPILQLPAVPVPLVGNFRGQFIYVTDTRAAWTDQRGLAGPATAGLIYWRPDGVAAWITF